MHFNVKGFNDDGRLLLASYAVIDNNDTNQTVRTRSVLRSSNAGSDLGRRSGALHEFMWLQVAEGGRDVTKNQQSYAGTYCRT